MSDNNSYTPYRDLKGEENSDHIIGTRKVPSSQVPKTLEQTQWYVSCKYCGSQKSATFTQINGNSIPMCSCRLPSTRLNQQQQDQAVGLGAIHLMQTDKSKFMEYLKRRESERSYKPTILSDNHAKSKKPN